MLDGAGTQVGDWISGLVPEREAIPATSAAVRRAVAAAIGPGAVAWGVVVAEQISEQLKAQVPDWPIDHSEDELQVLRRSTEASILLTLAALTHAHRGDLATSPEAVEFVRYYVRRGIAADHVIRSVHSTQSLLTLEVLRAINERVPAEDRMPTTMEATRTIARLWDRFAHTVAVFHADERERWAQSEMGLRFQVVDRVMAAERVSGDEASRQLGYPLAQRHVGAVLRVDTDVATRHIDVAAVARRAAQDAGCAQAPLILQRGHARADVWFPDPAIPPDRVIGATPWPAGVMIALGESGEGVSGFRSTYRQAGAACRVARLRGRNDRITRYQDVRLVSLLAADMDRAVAMARDVLGPLARDDAKMQALRDTLAAHASNGGNVNDTSRRIHAHRNTVTYRLRQIEQLLPGATANAEVGCALELAANFPHLILTPPQD